MTEPIGRTFSGLIDDVRIYRYALGAAEIEALYAGQGLETEQEQEQVSRAPKES